MLKRSRQRYERGSEKNKKQTNKQTERTPISTPWHTDLQPSSCGMLKRRRQRDMREGVRMKTEIELEEGKKILKKRERTEWLRERKQIIKYLSKMLQYHLQYRQRSKMVL